MATLPSFCYNLSSPKKGMKVKEELIGTWVEVELVNGKKWIGRLEEWDEEAIFISNGNEFGHPDHKGAECAADEAANVSATDQRKFSVS